MNRGLPITVLILPVDDDGEEEWVPACEAGLLAVDLSGLIPWRDKRRYVVRVYDDANRVVQEFEVENRKTGSRVRKYIYARVEKMSPEEVAQYNANKWWHY